MSTRAGKIRFFLAACLFVLPLLFGTLSVFVSITNPLAWAVFWLLALWLAIDASRAFLYMREIALVSEPPEFLDSFFFDGVPTGLLKKRAAECGEIVRDLELQAADFPELRGGIRQLLRREGLDLTIARLKDAKVWQKLEDRRMSSEAVAKEEAPRRDAVVFAGRFEQ